MILQCNVRLVAHTIVVGAKMCHPDSLQDPALYFWGVGVLASDGTLSRNCSLLTAIALPRVTPSPLEQPLFSGWSIWKFHHWESSEGPTISAPELLVVLTEFSVKTATASQFCFSLCSIVIPSLLSLTEYFFFPCKSSNKFWVSEFGSRKPKLWY